MDTAAPSEMVTIPPRSRPRTTAEHWVIAVLLASLLVTMAGAPSDAVAGDTRIAGRVIDAHSGAALASAYVRVVDTGSATITGIDGRFILESPAAAGLVLQATHVGYEVLNAAVEVGTGSRAPLILELIPAVLQLREVTVTPGAFRFMDSGEPASRQAMTRADIEAAPQFSEDIFRAIQRMPGLAAGDFGARFGIRGGRDDETLILVDGLEIYEPYHMKDFNEGAISIIDVEAIDGVELMTGGFPARYGNRRSGVFHIHSRRPRGDRSRHSIGLSLMNMRAASEGTFGAGRGSWLVSARRGYLDLVFSLMNLNDLPAPVYYDVLSKVTWELTPAQHLEVRLLHAGDSFEVDQEATTGFRDTIDARETANNAYDNSYLWATLTTTLSPAITVESTAHAGRVTRDRAGAEVFTSIAGAVYDVDKQRDLHVFGLKQDWVAETSPSLLWQFGFDLRRQRATYRLHSLVWQDPNDPTEDPLGLYPVETAARGEESGTLASAYGSTRVRLAAPLTIEAGARYDRASHSGDSDISPRLSAMVDLPTGSLMRLGWGQYRQIHDIHDEAAVNAGGRYDSSELSTQWTAGVEHLFATGTGVRVEAYHKHIDNPRSIYRNWVAGALDVFPETNEDLILVDLDEATERGVETYFSHDTGGRVALKGSYAFATATERLLRVENVNVPDSPLRFATENDAPRDQRHAISLDLIYRPTPVWTANVALAYHSGWPTTLAAQQETVRADGEIDVAARPEVLYSSRLPSYSRLDVRITRRMATSRGDVRVFFELINLMNRENVFAYDYEKEIAADGTPRLARDTESWFPLLPSLGVSWTW